MTYKEAISEFIDMYRGELSYAVFIGSYATPIFCWKSFRRHLDKYEGISLEESGHWATPSLDKIEKLM